MKPSILLAFAVALATLPLDASAEELLFERTVSINRSANIFDTNQFDLDLTLGNHPFAPSDPVTLFDDLTVTPANVGDAYDVLVGNSSFDLAAQRLTDAKNEFIRLVLTEDQPNGLVEQRGFSESSFFLGLASPTSPDLAGATLQRVRLAVDGFTLVDRVSGVSAASAGPPVNLELSIAFFGTRVPEPTGIWLLWGGLATLLGIGKRLRPVPVRVPARVPKQ